MALTKLLYFNCHLFLYILLDLKGGFIFFQHVLQCAPGILNKHIAKLLSSNNNLFSLSQENTIAQRNPYFEQLHSESQSPDNSNTQDLYQRYGYERFGGA
jgi:hypothetical protein